MPSFSATAPGKIILFGEHAVVYHKPGIAVPIHQVQAKAIVSADIQAPAGNIRIEAPEIGILSEIEGLPNRHPFRAAIDLLFQHLGIEDSPAFHLKVRSSIPVAAGLGSGAAVTVAILRAVSAFLGQQLPDETISALTFEIEKIYHGTPSGIDNTVITYQKPVFFIRDSDIETFNIHTPFHLIIGDSGIGSPTAVAVGDVRKLWEAQPDEIGAIFESIGGISQAARKAIENGDIEKIGMLMNNNHALLKKLTVSSPELDHLVNAAMDAGAFGAKLSGAGRGGNMIALVEESTLERVATALISAGAVNTIRATIINPN